MENIKEKFVLLQQNALPNHNSTDIQEHLETLYKYSSQCNSVFETGVRGCISSWDINQQSISTGIPVDEIYKGLWLAITEFLENNSNWYLIERFTNNNGLTIIGKKILSDSL